MKNLTLLISLALLLLASFEAKCQSNLKSQIDPDFIEMLKQVSSVQSGPFLSMKSLYLSRAHAYKEKDNAKFDYLIKLYSQLSKENKGIYKDEFLKKPNLNDLFSLYVNYKMQLNHWADKNQKMETEELIDWALEIATEDRMILTYYTVILFSPSNRNMSGRNLDFQQMGITQRQGSILFYNLISIFGVELNRKAYQTGKSSCGMAKRVAKRLPTFDGKTYDNFKAEDLSDFTYLINKIRKPLRFENMDFYNANSVIALITACK